MKKGRGQPDQNGETATADQEGKKGKTRRTNQWVVKQHAGGVWISSAIDELQKG